MASVGSMAEKQPLRRLQNPVDHSRPAPILLVGNLFGQPPVLRSETQGQPASSENGDEWLGYQPAPSPLFDSAAKRMSVTLCCCCWAAAASVPTPIAAFTMGDFGSGLLPEVTLPPLEAAEPTATEDEIHVLVTGFGPFKTNPLNPSFLITSALPATTTTASSSTSTPRTIRIHAHPAPIRVSYSAVRVAVPTILDAFKRAHHGQAPDLIVHVGMASTRHYYSVETRAHRDGYPITDVDGQLGYDDGEALWKQDGLPDVLRPGLPPTDSPHLSSPHALTESSDPKLPIRITPSPLDAAFLERWAVLSSAKSRFKVVGRRREVSLRVHILYQHGIRVQTRGQSEHCVPACPWLDGSSKRRKRERRGYWADKSIGCLLG
ncbi:predicted protein [Uncinocarpus reesii 1704]|uniref:Peptidase C15, pyroglutamyl peptidase I-like protein n=1 Tax=Uncinocarpus reesii (strain UAMH 1704) TaxID=336963 RepID=C4JG00_UNCRE|nr:uncharacterized protein UREG_01080 [Uncinocarpus reesii 1704]EEP76231.1 predicted protein [Uncinocarpus reesii 1704]